MGRYTLVACENKKSIQKDFSNFWWTTIYNSKENAEKEQTSTEHTDSAPYFQIIKLQSALSSLDQKKELYEIDFLSLSFQNESDLLRALVERKCLPHTNYSLEIQYKSKGENRYLDVITHHPFLRKCAEYCYNQKVIYPKKTIFELSEQAVVGYNAYVAKIFSYIKDPVASKIMQECYSVKNYQHLIPSIISSNINSYQEYEEKTFFTPEESKDFRDIKSSIKKELQSYKNLRGVLIWENLYQAGKLNYLLKTRKQEMPSTTSTYFYQEPVLKNKEGDLEFLTEEELQNMAGPDDNATYSYYRK